MKKVMRNAALLSLVCIMSLGAAGCGAKPDTTSTTSTTDTATSETKETPKTTETPKIPEKVTIKVFSNVPDRTAGQGKLEQLLLDNYVKENPNVEIVVEALQDEPYKQKFKTYAASNQLPDLLAVWGQPAFFNPVMESGYVEELKADDYKDYNFFNGSLDGFSLNGKIYGLPRNTDSMVLYYNKQIFEQNNVKVPETFEELITATKAFREKGIAPCAMNGKDRWPIAVLYHDLVIKNGGDQKLMYDALYGNKDFATEPVYLKAAQDIKLLMDNKFFQDSFISADYGAANNLFGQGKAAMYYMGSWEASMATNEAFPVEFRENMDVIPFPVIAGGKGKVTDIPAWNGGGYAVSSNSPVKEEAIKLLNYMMKPENWAKNAWELGVTVPAQKYAEYLTGKETIVQTKITQILDSSTSISATPWNDLKTPNFKTASEDLIQSLAAGVITPEEFVKGAQEAATE